MTNVKVLYTKGTSPANYIWVTIFLAVQYGLPYETKSLHLPATYKFMRLMKITTIEASRACILTFLVLL